MKFQKNDVVRRVLPSGTQVGGLMIVITEAGSKCTAVRDVTTGNVVYISQVAWRKQGKLQRLWLAKVI